MNKSSKHSADYDIRFFLDITQEVCPLTFVRTKLLLERMKPGEIAEVRLKGDEPLDNVPRSVRDHGNTVLSLEPENADAVPDAVHKLLIRKE